MSVSTKTRSYPRLHVMIGEGGVGKTTLASAYALALAEKGGRVALLSIDPARRLQSALGLSLDESARPVTLGEGGELHAALLVPDATLRRWATEGLSEESRARVLENRIFRILADRLATTTDVIAAIRIAEWMDNDTTLTDFVIDTAPGRNGIELVRRPRALASLAQGKFIGWLRRPHGLGVRLLRALAPIGGSALLGELAQLMAAVEEPFHHVLVRLEQAQTWLHDPSTAIFLVTTVREDAIHAASILRDALSQAGLSPAAVVVNRTFAPEIMRELELGQADNGEANPPDPEAITLLTYMRNYLRMQSRVLAEAGALAPSVIPVRTFSGLDDPSERLAKLASVGHAFNEELR